MTENPHFETASSWKMARAMLTFEPLKPAYTAGLHLQSIRIHVRDHKMRVPGDWHLPYPTGAMGRTERLPDVPHASELGLEPPPDDIDGRSPAVVLWHDGELFYLVASGSMPSDELVRIANSIYRKELRRRPGSRS
jgi:hypothetical protein